MSILEIYLLGVVAAAVHIIWFEYQFDHNKQLSNVTKKEWLQDAAISLFSWVAFVLAIIVTIGDLMVASRRIVRKERPEYIVFLPLPTLVWKWLTIYAFSPYGIQRSMSGTYGQNVVFLPWW